MKKTFSIILFAALCLALFFTQALASSPATSLKPKQTPLPNETSVSNDAVTNPNHPGKPDEKGKKPAQAEKHSGKKVVFKGEVASYENGALVVKLKDGSSVTVSVDENSDVKIAGPKDSSGEITAGSQVIVQAALSGDQSYLALRIRVIPARPQRVHRVGIVTAYAPGVSITIQDAKGSSTFQIAADVKILPQERAADLQEGARVTIISPRDPANGSLVARGIVVHPQK